MPQTVRRQSVPWLPVVAAMGLFVLGVMVGPPIYTDGGIEDSSLGNRDMTDEDGEFGMAVSRRSLGVVAEDAGLSVLEMRVESGHGRICQRIIATDVKDSRGRLLFSKTFDELETDAWFCPVVAFAFVDVDLDGRKDILHRHIASNYHEQDDSWEDGAEVTGKPSRLYVTRLGPQTATGWRSTLWQRLSTWYVARKLKVVVTNPTPATILSSSERRTYNFS